MEKRNDFDLFGIEEVKMLGELANVKLPDPTLLDYFDRRANRTILWNTDIDDDLVEIYHDILRWNKEDVGKAKEDCTPIKIYINSNGGDLVSVNCIIDLILLSHTPVITIGLGKCYSSGGLLLMAGHKRYLLPSCTVLIHDGSSMTYGAIGKMLDNLEFTKQSESKMKDYILSRTTIKEEEYDANYRKDWWIFAEDAVNKYGIADKVVTDINEIL